MNSKSRFIYVHDPMCSWCWGHRPVWEQFEAELAAHVAVEYRVGGLAPDNDEPMPAAQQAAISGYWIKIHQLLGVPFNMDFWTENEPRRSTYPACRAVIAARWQGAELPMMKALQRAYYLRALNPSNKGVHSQLAAELFLDVGQFEQDLSSEALETAFQEELAFSRSLPINGFPSMVLIHHGQAHSFSLNYQDYREALAEVLQILSQ